MANKYLDKMLADIQPSDGLFINCENNSVNAVFASTITAGIYKRQKQFIMEELINTSNNNARTITTQYGKKGWSAMLDSDRDSLTCVQNSETYRIRKLTPRECFRLMGVSETEIDTIQAANLSDTRQYFLAGNSIVVDVLEGIFRKMFIDKEITELKLF